MKAKQWGWLLVALAAAGAGSYWLLGVWSRDAGKQPKTPPPAPVVTAKAETRNMPRVIDAVGRAEAYESTTIRARVDGQVAAVPFVDGQKVKPGDVLVRLDPSDLEAKARQAEAAAARDQVQVAKARADLERYTALRQKNFVSEEKLNEVKTNLLAAEATLKADQAAQDLARLQLGYATVKAPIGGIVGARLVAPGAAVRTNDTALAVINRVRPLYVTFAVPERHLPAIREATGKGGRLKARVTVPGNRDQAYEGEVRFVDNAVDASTGTLQMKVLLPNDDERLTPGQFLNVALALGGGENAVVVPTEAVQQGPAGTVVFVVDAENVVQPKRVEAGDGRQGLTVILKGVSSGDTVVTEGHLRLVPGAKVMVKGGEKAGGSAPTAPAVAPAPTKS